jgi:hypothetical protein
MTALLRSILFAASEILHIAVFAQTSPNATPECVPHQLKASTPPGPDGGAGNSASVFQASNISQETCNLTGVPILRLLNERHEPMNLAICSNCVDYIFPPRAIRTVTLHPGDSAHFLIGLRFADESESGCGRLSRIDVLLEGRTRPLEFGFAGLRVCGKINVSAWRSGVYTAKELERDSVGGNGTGFGRSAY